MARNPIIKQQHAENAAAAAAFAAAQAQAQAQFNAGAPQPFNTNSGSIGYTGAMQMLQQASMASPEMQLGVQSTRPHRGNSNNFARQSQGMGVNVGAGIMPKPDYECINNETRLPGVRRKYCPHEVTALVMGVQRYADDSCPWSCILHDADLGTQFHGRSGVDLKDKWRTLIKNRPELASFTENRKNNRQYRPFNQEEEQALIEGVRRYSGERNIWSMILKDVKLGSRFNERSNVQLKDKFRTMKRAGQIIEVPPPNGSSTNASVSGRKPAAMKSGGMKKVNLTGPKMSISTTSTTVDSKHASLSAPIVVCNV